MNSSGVVSPFTLALVAFATGCGDLPPSPVVPAVVTALNARGIAPGQANVVEVTAAHRGGEHHFIISDRTIPHGWTTFRFDNASPSDHFVLLYSVPDEARMAAEDAGQDLLEHWYQTVTVPFQETFNPYIRGEIGYGDFVDDLIGALSVSAPWYFAPGAPTMGGPGLTAAGHSSETTVNLEPGTYVIECYVKNENQEFHSYLGMLGQLTVTEAASGAREPRATASISISQPDRGGIQIPDDLRPGMQTFAIHFGEQPQFGYEHLLGHNAHLVALDDKDDSALLAELADWMDWMKPGGLSVRAPEGARFLGGSMEMAGGKTAYYTVNLKPGDYAWIAEVPDPAGKNMLKTFTVPSGR
ncbi:MAG TPA: hypothetical protein VFI91_02005 [Longimicrobiaceae bacterium]|nr:hypothetical protein [Longimicrobiaceae bacterium]